MISVRSERDRLIVAGAGLGTLALISVSVITVGIAAWRDYLRFVAAYAADSGAAP